MSIPFFALFVAIGVAYRGRAEINRPMMVLTSVSVIGAATGRMEALNALYAGAAWETLFSEFLMQLVFGAILLIVECIVSKTIDRWFASGFAGLTLGCVAISLRAKT